MIDLPTHICVRVIKNNVSTWTTLYLNAREDEHHEVYREAANGRDPDDCIEVWLKTPTEQSS